MKIGINARRNRLCTIFNRPAAQGWGEGRSARGQVAPGWADFAPPSRSIKKVGLLSILRSNAKLTIKVN
ncbi:hypothetical protein CEW81_03355 [Kluyvera genomosp. 3]|uniref:Uncharacterized protein n=1 Tax=Kluyvera genomosp. 3 TaxID=2774055 RepID=A0A248KGL1_9ENTR|nr:hypothetical protein CEW81_03355 [Kluyvera genomosp. 3]